VVTRSHNREGAKVAKAQGAKMNLVLLYSSRLRGLRVFAIVID